MLENVVAIVSSYSQYEIVLLTKDICFKFQKYAKFSFKSLLTFLEAERMYNYVKHLGQPVPFLFLILIHNLTNKH